MKPQDIKSVCVCVCVLFSLNEWMCIKCTLAENRARNKRLKKDILLNGCGGRRGGSFKINEGKCVFVQCQK